MNYSFTIKHQGFTLIETLFAVLIFSAALISLMSISAKGISATSQVRNETTAYYLAQEGIEVARAMRDDNIAALTNWNAGFFDSNGAICTDSNPCTVYYNGGTLLPLINRCSGSCEVFINSIGRFDDTGDPSGFQRKITISPGSGARGNEEMIISSVVTWQAKKINRSVELKTIMKKWR